MYTSPTCPYCERAKELLHSLNLEYDDINIEARPEERVKLIQEHNWMTTPAVFIDGELIGGYDELAKMHAKGELK